MQWGFLCIKHDTFQNWSEDGSKWDDFLKFIGEAGMKLDVSVHSLLKLDYRTNA